MWIFDEVVELVVEQRRREEKPTLVARFGNDGICCRMRKAWTSDALRCQYLPFWTVLPCDYIEFRERQNWNQGQIILSDGTPHTNPIRQCVFSFPIGTWSLILHSIFPRKCCHYRLITWACLRQASNLVWLLPGSYIGVARLVPSLSCWFVWQLSALLFLVVFLPP